MNPNARSFNFNPNSSGFVPPGQHQQQGQPHPQGGYDQQGFTGPGAGAPGYGAGGYGAGYGGYAAGGFTEQGGYYPNAGQQAYTQSGFDQGRLPAHRQAQAAPPQQQQQPQAPGASSLPTKPGMGQTDRKPVSISIGGGSSLAAAPKKEESPRKPVSISIGGGSSASKEEPTVQTAAAKQEEAKPAPPKAVSSIKAEEGVTDAWDAEPSSSIPATDSTPAAAAAALPSKGSTDASAPASRSESPTPGLASKGGMSARQKAKVDDKVQKAHMDADKVLAETKKLTDEETLKDLFGEQADSMKSHLNVVFIGHVDAGKSTMGGNLLYLTGMVDKRTLEKYEKDAKEAGRESWYLSWALDSTPQEREKGKTVEVGRAYFETGKRRYTILDAPGHKSYVPSMISGAAQADVAILVISARKGEFETGFERGGQTREHAMLVKTAGVQRLIVVVNKMDEPTVKWEKARYDEIVGKLSPFLRSAGFAPKDVSYIPVSAFAGQNLKEPVPREVCSWYDGEPLLTFLDNLELGDRKISEPLKMPISEKYNDMGTVIVGKLESGKVRKGDTLILMPNKTQIEVVGIFNEVEEEVVAAVSGDNVRIKIKGIDHEDVSVGFVLTDTKSPVHVVTKFEAQLAILEHRNIICPGYSAVMHVHTLSEEVNLIQLLHYYDKKTGKKSKKPPQFAKKGMKVVALIETTAPVCLEKFSEHPQLGRFTLRDEGRTVAIGRVTKLRMNEEAPDVSKLTLDGAA
ncbi:hypothetical protein K437DRAFT_235143 [Tilletiaria anomala UBC 951]|uniref:Eukaryotic peptide chain release factor GTP-binding subunit n=1 Tax=Tilletiaria anomala (strain ATCC 24038 / CBS 436.72 / UBC 951) TaxID=1037660 RepID=A0A066W259_TILAU|nr:uncharacterized protein K437DRAFT_235143 [Tilletiaria anomala UBC 951]KDN46648.1 hypothetical protein K437DRAFT_235143 [Tilletiaria anomala UBC 951]